MNRLPLDTNGTPPNYSDRTCGSCRFWHQIHGLNPDGTLRNPPTGHCRQGPPVPMVLPVGPGQARISIGNLELPDHMNACGQFAEATVGRIKLEG